MADAKSQDGAKHPEHRIALGKLIESALARHGASARAIAARAGIGASHLSKVLKAKRSLRKAKLLMLADLLGLDQEKVLRLAGFGRFQKSGLNLGRVALLGAMDKFTLNVVVTPRFYDAAVFMWIFGQRPFDEVGVESQLRRADWGAVPGELASYTYSVGFHNHRSALFGLARWNYLCLDKSCALIGRSSARGKETLSNLAEQAKKRGKRLQLIAVDQSSVDLLRTEGEVGDDFDTQMIPNPDIALETFRGGTGDLFLSGLPQRLALRNGEFKELVTHGKDYPGFYSFKSLICSERMFQDKRPLLHAIEALWYDTCRRLYAEADFRALVFAEICDILERLGIEKHSFIKDDFDALFSPAGLALEVFAQFPAQLWEEESKLRAGATARTPF